MGQVHTIEGLRCFVFFSLKIKTLLHAKGMEEAYANVSHVSNGKKTMLEGESRYVIFGVIWKVSIIHLDSHIRTYYHL